MARRKATPEERAAFFAENPPETMPIARPPPTNTEQLKTFLLGNPNAEPPPALAPEVVRPAPKRRRATPEEREEAIRQGVIPAPTPELEEPGFFDDLSATWHLAKQMPGDALTAIQQGAVGLGHSILGDQQPLPPPTSPLEAASQVASGPSGARYLASRFYQNLVPGLLQGEVGESQLVDSPASIRGEEALVRGLEPVFGQYAGTAGATLTGAASALGALPSMAIAGPEMLLSKGAAAGSRLLPTLLKAAGRGAAQASIASAIQSTLGAPEGKREAQFIAGATDPLAIGLGGTIGGVSGGIQLRRANAAAAVEEATHALEAVAARARQTDALVDPSASPLTTAAQTPKSELLVKIEAEIAKNHERAAHAKTYVPGAEGPRPSQETTNPGKPSNVSKSSRVDETTASMSDDTKPSAKAANVWTEGQVLEGPAESAPLVARAKEADAELAKTPAALETPGPQKVTFPQNAQLDPQLVADLELAKKLAKDKPLMQRLAKHLLIPEFRVPLELASFLRQLDANRNAVNMVQQRLFPIFRRELKKPEVAAQARAFVQQRIDTHALDSNPRFIKVNELSELQQSVFKETLDAAKNQSLMAAEKGLLSPEQMRNQEKMHELGAQYLQRTNMKKMSGDWRPPKGEVKDDVIRLFVDNGLSHPEAEMAFINLMSKEPGVSDQAHWTKTAPSVFKDRTNMPKQIQRAVGVINDPAFVVSHTAGELERLLGYHAITESIASPDYRGKYWDTKPFLGAASRPLGDPNLPALDNRRLYGELDGKWVHAELFDNIMNSDPKVHSGLAMQMVSKMVQFSKAMQIGLNAVAMQTDFVSNFFNLAGAGLPAWNPRMYSYMGGAVRAVKEWNTGRNGEYAKLMRRALDMNAVRPGIGGEIKGAVRLAELYLAKPREGLMGLYDHGITLYKKGMMHIGEFRELTDTVQRLAAFNYQVDRGMKSILKLSRVEAEARATAVVNRNFASSGTAAPLAKKLSEGGAGVVAPYMQWAVDNVRVHADGLWDAQRGFTGPNAKWYQNINSGEGLGRMFNQGVMMTIIMGGFKAARIYHGITDQEVATLDGGLKNSHKEFNPIRAWWPGVDAQGRAQSVSLSRAMPIAAFMQGPENAGPLARLGSNLAMIPFSGSTYEDSAKRSLALIGVKPDDTYSKKIQPGQEWKEIVRLGVEAGPATVRDIYRHGRRAKLWGELDEQTEAALTPGQAVMAMTPFKVEPSAEESATANRMQLRGKIGALKGASKKLQQAPGSPEDTLEGRQRYLEEMQKLRRRQGG